jgi:hypothetical protein
VWALELVEFGWENEWVWELDFQLEWGLVLEFVAVELV